QYLIPLWMKKHSTFPELIFHVYGDFTLSYHKWSAMKHLIKGIKVKFCVASTAQKDLIQKLIPNDIHHVPFAVDPQDFFYDEKLRLRIRKKLNLQEDENLYIFTGRLSYQKNIHLLVESFLSYVERKSSSEKLLIFGHFDDLGDSFSDYQALTGHYYHQVNDILKNHPRQDQIIFKGMADSKELNEYYNASDFFINLSTHNDEDFGMSVAEASHCGLSSIMTSWGGLKDFNFEPNKYLQVNISPRKSIDLSLFEVFLGQRNNYDRKKLSQEALERFSIQSSTERLKDVLKVSGTVFEDFTHLFYLVHRNVLYTKKPYLNTDDQLNSLYQELYVSYL
ncbi:MAG: glycosyltransferase, partial [Bacteriovoracaceae bacterium]